jgi:hypothetical protein
MLGFPFTDSGVLEGEVMFLREFREFGVEFDPNMLTPLVEFLIHFGDDCGSWRMLLSTGNAVVVEPIPLPRRRLGFRRFWGRWFAFFPNFEGHKNEKKPADLGHKPTGLL